MKFNKKRILRILLIVIVVILLVLTGIFISSKINVNPEDTDSVTVTVTVADKQIKLDGKRISYSSLEKHLEDIHSQKSDFTIALINDGADTSTYNSVVALLSGYDIIHETLPFDSTFDEVAATADEY